MYKYSNETVTRINGVIITKFTINDVVPVHIMEVPQAVTYKIMSNHPIALEYAQRLMLDFNPLGYGVYPKMKIDNEKGIIVVTRKNFEYVYQKR